MQSILLVSKDKKKSFKHAMSISQKNKIDQIDITVENSEKIIGIEDIRNIQKKLFLKPIKSDVKTIIIDTSFGLTIEAQNALLKILEEPPANTIIILTVLNKDLLLPTILSRCKIIGIKEETYQLSDVQITEYLTILKHITSDGVGKRLKFAQDFGKNKEEAIIWLEQMLVVVRKKMLEEINDSSEKNKKFSSSYYLNILKHFQETYIITKTTNVNQRFALENLFLSL